MPSPVLQFKRGPSANIGVTSFKSGEPGFTTDKYDFYIGLDNTPANNKFFGSARYWNRENGSLSAKLNLVDKDGTKSITFKSPNTISGSGVTYTFPESAVDGYFLKTNSVGELSWEQVVSNINIAADTGTPDSVSTGSTITFVGGTNINTAVTNDTITINLDDDVYISGIATVGGLLTLNTGIYNVGGASTIYDLDVLTTLNVGGKLDVDNGIDVSGNGVFSGIVSFTNTTDSTNYQTGAVVIDGGLGIGKALHINGDIHANGNVTIGGTTVTLISQDVYIQNKDIILGYTTATTPNDDSANHAGVAIASTVGTPLISMISSGINTLPDTYKQMMWIQKDTWTGFSTDAFVFNYGLAIGTTSSVADGVRLAVGSNVRITDDSVTATTGNFTNLIGSVSGTISTATRATTVDTVTASDANSTHYITFVDSNNGSATPETVYTDDGIYYNPGTNTFTTQHGNLTGNLVVSGIATVGTFKVSGTSAIGITGISTTLSENSDSYLPTQKAVKDYIDAIDNDDDLNIAGDSGTGTVDLDTQSLAIYGTANEVVTTGAGTSITVGLPDDVTITTSLTTPTVKATNLKANDGTTSITIDNTTGNVGINSNLTVTGNLYVFGTTTEVNTDSLKVQDPLIDLGLIDNGSGQLVPPTSDLNIDIGILLNWYDSSAKKAAVYWDDSTRRIGIASDITEANNVITEVAYAPIEIGSLWVTDCAGTSQVISCTGAERFLENITVDCGTF